MNGMHEHERARLLLEERALGIISESDSDWLAKHLAECEKCSAAESEMQAAIALLKSEPVTAPAFLVTRTKARVRVRARELREEAERMRMLWLSVGLAVMFSAGTFYGGLLLYGAGWLTFHGTAGVLSAMGVFWFWIAPAVLLMAAAIYGKGEWLRGLQENSFGRGLGND